MGENEELSQVDLVKLNDQLSILIDGLNQMRAWLLSQSTVEMPEQPRRCLHAPENRRRVRK